MRNEPGPPVARRPADLVATGAGLTVLCVCAIPASSGRVGSVERAVFEAVNGLPDALEPVALGAQFLGVLVVGPIVAVAAFLARRRRLAVGALLVTGAKLLAERGVWEVVTRERPGVTEPEAIIRGGVATTGVSFVSGHVVLTAGLAWVVTPYLPPRWRWVPWALVTIVAFARVYLGAHNPLDVVGGAGLGVAIGGLVNLVVYPPSSTGAPTSEPYSVHEPS